MHQEKALSSVFNMSLGFIPIMLAMLLSQWIRHDISTFMATASGVVGIGLLTRRRMGMIPNFILYISTASLFMLTIALALDSRLVPEKDYLLTLEICTIIPLFVFHLHRKRIIEYFIHQKEKTNPLCRHFFAQGAEASAVSARMAIILSILHFVAMSLAMMTRNPLDGTLHFLLHKITPFSVFLLSILFNQIAICYFNRLMSRQVYVPVVNVDGDVIGKVPAEEIFNSKKKYINPFIRIAIRMKGRLFLCARPMDTVIDQGKTDVPMEGYLLYGESLSDGVVRILHHTLPETKIKRVKFNFSYHCENPLAKRLIYLFSVDVDDDTMLNSLNLNQGKLWGFKQIQENIGKGFFSHCFEEEFKYLKQVIDTREKYKES